LDKERVKDRKNGKKPRQFEGSKKTFNGFDVQTDRAAFSCTDMIMLIGYQGFGGKNPKHNTDH